MDKKKIKLTKQQTDLHPKGKKIPYFNVCYPKAKINKNGPLLPLTMVFDKLCNKLVFVSAITSIKTEIRVFSY